MTAIETPEETPESVTTPPPPKRKRLWLRRLTVTTVVVGAVAVGVAQYVRAESLGDRLSTARGSLVETHKKLDDTTFALGSTKNDLESAQADLDTAQSDLTTAQDQLDTCADVATVANEMFESADHLSDALSDYPYDSESITKATANVKRVQELVDEGGYDSIYELIDACSTGTTDDGDTT